MSNTNSTGPFVKDSYSRGGIQPRKQMNAIGRMLSRVTFGPGIIGRCSPYGLYIEAEQTRNRLFDLYDVVSPADGTNTVKVRGTADDKVVAIIGQWVAVTGGAGELDAAITITATTYIYVNVKRSDNTATLETSATLADGNDDEERFYLWSLPWDATAGAARIDTANIVDLRGMPRWVAGA